ncbi:glycosyltransferase family 4 protein [Aestuariimicrobium kwangyangense]|uniref:glycosyltransferase family 4 protein n=1 Tax=Aestuariimicrobium kwangyangense TaxID=396389 RepID=UPI000421E226|nr:glycosyltransferase family 4 protein [Aestuariimicrobium kwangyangense]
MTASRRPGRLGSMVRDLWLAGSTGAALLHDDAAHAVVQVARRVGVTHLPHHGNAAWQALMAHISDRPDAVRTQLEAWWGPSPMPGTRARRAWDALAVSVAVNRGLAELVPADLLTNRDRARLRLQAGDFRGALAELDPASPLAQRIRSERDAMTPGVRLPERPPLHVRAAGRRVLFVLTNSLPHTQSGYTRRSQAVMQAVQQAGWEVQAATRLGYPTTIGRLGGPHLEQVGTVPVHRLLPWHQPASLMQRLTLQADLLTDLVGEFRPRVLHTTTDHTNGVAVREVAERTGLPWVYEMRGQLEYTWLASRPDWARHEAETSERLRLQRDRETELAMSADAVVVLSEVQRADLLKRGVPEDHITVVPNAVDESLFNRDATPSQARAQLGLPREGEWVGSVSSVVGYEGFDVLLRAVHLLRAGGRDVRCAIVGHGVALPSLQSLAHNLGLDRVCQFPGRQDRARALTWVEALDVVAVPRLDTPVCRMVTPLKPVEAWALARPVVASDLPALAEVVSPAGGSLARAGDPLSLAEHLSAVLDDPDALQRAGLLGRSWAAERTWRRAASHYDRVYATLGAD